MTLVGINAGVWLGNPTRTVLQRISRFVALLRHCDRPAKRPILGEERAQWSDAAYIF